MTRRQDFHPFSDAVTNELDGRNWQTVETAMDPIDPDDFAECWSLLTPEQQAQAEPAWLAFLAKLSTGERDQIDEAFAAVCEVLGIDPPACDEELVDMRARELADRLLEVTDDPDWYRAHLAPEPETSAESASIVDRLPLASGFDDTQPGHRSAPDHTRAEPLLGHGPDWVDASEPTTVYEHQEPDHAPADVEPDHAETSAEPEHKPAPDWQAEYRQLAHALATRNPWRAATACLAVVFVLFLGAGLYEYERARTESTTLRAQLAEHERGRVLDSSPATLPVMDARVIPVDAAANTAQVRWIVDREHAQAPEWQITVDVGTFERAPGMVVIPYSENRYKTMIDETPITLLWGE